MSDGAFAAEVERALSSLGVEPDAALVDGVIDPRGAAAAVEAFAKGEGGTLLVRVHPPLGPAEAGYAPAPRDPAFLHLARGANGVSARTASVRGGAVDAVEASRVRVERERVRCCETPSCDLEREIVRAWLDAGAGKRWLVSEGRPFADKPDDGATAFANALASALGVDVEGAEAAAPPDVDGARSAALAASVAARYAARTEGEHLVFRDLASAGPRATSRRNFTIAAVVGGLAVLVWLPTIELARSGAGARAVAVGAIAALLSLTAYAFFGVARFSAKYAASSSPLAAFGAGRFVVAPWVARGGAIDLRPEGRFGAAIPCNEVTGVVVAPRDDRFAVVLESDHGPIDAVAEPREPVIAWLCGAMARAVELSKHPSAQPSPRQRARAKAQPPAERA